MAVEAGLGEIWRGAISSGGSGKFRRAAARRGKAVQVRSGKAWSGLLSSGWARQGGFGELRSGKEGLAL